MESQVAYKLLFTEYPDVVNVEQMCEMLGGICDKTAYKLLRSGEITSFVIGFCGLGKLEVSLSAAAIESRSSTFWNTWN